MKALEILQQLANDFLKDRKGDDLSGPWLLDIDGSPWTAATDSKSILFVRAALTAAVPCEKTRDKIVPLFTLPHNEPYLTSADTLRAFAGDHVHQQRCPACEGTSARSDHVYCSWCEGEGVTEGDIRPGWLMDLPLDRNRLAGLLRAFHGTLDLYIGQCPHSKKTDDRCLWIDGGGVRAALMAMTDSKLLPDHAIVVDGWDKAPKFPQVAVEVMVP